MQDPENPGPDGTDTFEGVDPAGAVAEIANLADAARNPKKRGGGGGGSVGPLVDDAGAAPGSGNDAVAPAPGFHEANCRIGIGGLVGLVESGLTSQVRNLATRIGGAKIGERFADRAGFQPEVKTALVESAVEVCRTHNLGIGPEATLVACVAKIGFDYAALLRELRAVAAELKADPAFRDPPPHGTST